MTQRIRELLGRIDAGDRAAFVLRYIEQLSLEEAAAIASSPWVAPCTSRASRIYPLTRISAWADMTDAAIPREPLAVEQVFRALADPTRLRILHLLREGALCVGDLVSVLDVPQPTASRHLAYLRRSGLVVDERRGQWSFYKLAPAATGFHEKVLDVLEAAGSKQARGDDAALRALRRAGGCCPQHTGTKGRTNGHRRS